MDLSVIIPCCNEEDGISGLRDKLFPVLQNLAKGRSVELLLIDDGSTDRTHELLRTLPQSNFQIHIIKHEKNKGLGAALRTGFAAARGAVVVTTDSDGTYSFEEIPKLLELMHDGVDIVTASPYHSRGAVENVPPYRLILSRGASFMYEILLHRKIATYTSMFRAYRQKVVRTVPFESSGFLSITELLVNAVLMGYRVAEYPTVLRVRRTGVSKARILRIIKSHLKYQANLLLMRMRLAPKPVSNKSGNEVHG